METNELLVQAAFDGNLDELTRLLMDGGNVDAEGRYWNALHAAIENGQVSCVRLLIAHGANVNQLSRP
ncbi:MAG: ankyrin repeat domain-containing protein [Xanthomonadaceae bacterium]|nr:ankyrin repeat domain-containing protein [Xanthomonadaceae bacterium]